MEERNDGKDRLVAYLRHDKRIQIDVNAELAKLENRQSYHFDKEFEVELGVSHGSAIDFEFPVGHQRRSAVGSRRVDFHRRTKELAQGK